MQIDTAEKLIAALRTSGLFDSEQLMALIRELSAVHGDLQSLLRHLVEKKRLTVYQLRKVIHGKSAELFLGPYVITDKLGEGGMGRVFRARQVRLGREVALKVVRTSLLSNPLVRKRYDREVQTASTLHHPNIVGVFDAGEIDGRYYLAMEFVDGIDLSRLVREHRPLTVPEACEYTRQASLGLHYAHEQGLVHRDIKPSNIVVAGERHLPQATEPAIVKILDMGLVRYVGFDDGGGGDLTRAGTVVGTPDYMAPEQAKNSSAVDARADLYSMGCAMYFLLTGQPPFPTGTAIEKLLQHQLDSPVPVQALRPDVPRGAAEVVSRLMAKQPGDRYQTAAEAAAALEPLAQYPHGSPPVPVRVWQEGEKPSPSGRPSMPSLASPTSTPQEPANERSRPLAQPVAPSDHTPRPRGLPPSLHAVVESPSPFSTLSEPPSGPITPASRVEKLATSSRSRNKVWIVIALAALALGFIAVAGWLIFGGSSKPADAGADTSSSGESNPKPPSRPVSTSRSLPLADLIVDKPSLVVIAHPSTFLRDRDSPYSGGAGRMGPGRLAAWAAKLGNSTGLSLSDSERVVLSFPSDSLDRFLAVSEGSYLTPSFANLVETRFKPQASSSARKPQIALVPTGDSYAYGVASDSVLLNQFIRRLKNSDPVRPHIEEEMEGAINRAGNPLLFATAGPSFKLPFEFMSVDKPSMTLQDLKIDLVTVRLARREKLDFEIVLQGKVKAAIDEFVRRIGQKLMDEYPEVGPYLANQLDRMERTFEPVNGKHQLTLRMNVTADQWSAFLERIVPP